MSLLVAIPVFNEHKHILRVLTLTKQYTDNILVVDDGSTDDTPRLLRKFPDISIIRHESNLGYGQSLIDAFTYAHRKKYQWLISMDCDEQHEPAEIPRFIEAINRNDSDIISGSRYLLNLPNDDLPPPDRRAINQRITDMLNRRLGLRITDAFCGFKACRVAALNCLRLSEPGYAIPLQFWAEAARVRLRISELPVRTVYADPNRYFGGELDDPKHRYRHYMDVFEKQMNRSFGPTRNACRACGREAHAISACPLCCGA